MKALTLPLFLIVFALSQLQVHAAQPARQPNYVGQMAKELKPTRSLTYKTVGKMPLRMDIFEPAGSSKEPRACFLAIHGGGWVKGGPASMYPFADWAAKQGMVAVSIQYRRYKTDPGTTVFNCVEDARSAVRYLREHAKELNIDPEKIVTCGASAGGHLAIGVAQFNEVNEKTDNMSVSAVPNAAILLSPVIDTSTEGYGNAKIGDRWKELSPAHRVVPGLPPTITFHGTGDTTTPYKGAKEFQDAMLKAGNDSTLITVEGAIHTYMFKDKALYEKTLGEMGVFLKKRGFIKE